MTPSSSAIISSHCCPNTGCPLPRAVVQRMAKYSPPLEQRRHKTRLDFNENTEGFPHILKPEENLTDYTTYPEYEEFEQALATQLGIPHENLLILNGSDEGLAIVPQTFIQPQQDIALITRPSFAMIRHNLQLAEAQLHEVLLTDDLTYPLEELEAVLTEHRPKLAVFATPDNPTGAVLPKATILRWCQQFPETVFLIDAAYSHYASIEESLVQEATTQPNLLVLQTFSKAWGLAGLRLGVLVGHAQHIQWLACVRSPYSINSMAIRAGVQLLKDEPLVRQQSEALLFRKERLLHSLQERGFEIKSGPTNFFLMKLGLNATPFTNFCFNNSILIRNQTQNPKLAGWVRVSVGTEGENLQFLECLDAFLQRTALVFDLDDTLIDTTQSFDVVVAILVRKYSTVPLGQNELQSLRDEGGFNDDWDATLELLKRRGETNHTYQEIAEEGNRVYQRIAKDVETWRLPVEHLKALAKRYRLFIYTGRNRHELEPIWGEELTPLFEKIYCSDDIAGLVKKPSPDYLIHIKQVHGLTHAWYIGNSVDDMRCAVGAGYQALGVTTTFTAEALSKAGAELLIASPQELLSQFACEAVRLV